MNVVDSSVFKYLAKEKCDQRNYSCILLHLFNPVIHKAYAKLVLIQILLSKPQNKVIHIRG